MDKLKRDIQKLAKSVRKDTINELAIELIGFRDEVAYIKEWPARSKSVYLDAIDRCINTIKNIDAKHKR